MSLLPLPDAEDLTSNATYVRLELERLAALVDVFIHHRDAGEPGFDALAARFAAERPALREARARAARRGVELPMELLSAEAQLSDVEEDLLWLTAAVHLSPHLAARLLQAQGDVLKSHLELGFALRLVGACDDLLLPAWALHGELTALRRGWLRLEAPSNGTGLRPPLAARTLRATHFISALLAGSPGLDVELAGACRLVRPQLQIFDLILSEATQQKVERFIAGFPSRSRGGPRGPIRSCLAVSGPQGIGKTALAEVLGATFERLLLCADLPALAAAPQPHEALQLLFANAAVLGAVLVLDRPHLLLQHHPHLTGALTRAVQSYAGVLIIEVEDLQEIPPALEAALEQHIELDPLDASRRQELWEGMLPLHLNIQPDLPLTGLAQTHELSPARTRLAVRWASQLAAARPDATLTYSDLLEGAQSQLASRLGRFTEATHHALTLEHLILPDEPLTRIHELLDACRQRQRVLGEWGFGRRLSTGRGIVALFCGEAGTGKTLTAEILAGELRQPLRRVSIPKVVSKWVGETEKNIRAIFAGARADHAILLFDEADSLFTTRVRVEDSQSHYQNMEVNNLLQEVERYDGIVLLTTNLETNIDDAFQRRILFKVDFPNPDEEQRQRLWRSLIPSTTPVEDDPLDFQALAEYFELTGGQIKNAILQAAYRCAARDHGLTQLELERAARRQAQAAGKLVSRLEA